MTSAPTVGLLDTSVFIAQESGRALDQSKLPAEEEVSVVTIAELEVGVLAARDDLARTKRMRTLARARRHEPLPIDERVASSWALLRVHLARSGRRVPVNDLWIGATAVACGIPVITQDDDFDPIEGVAGLAIIKI